MKWQQTFSTPLFRSQDWMLPAMILGAVFIHGLAFYLIQASPPKTTKKMSFSARLSVLNPQNSRDLSLLRWIENHDPAAIAYQTESPVPPHLFDTAPYQPSYEKVLPEPLPILGDENRLRHETFFPPGPVPGTQTQRKEITKKWPELLSKIDLSPFLNLKNPARFSPPRMGDTLPGPTRFLVVQARQGDEKFFFLLQSSGSDQHDRYARDWLAAADISAKGDESTGWVQIDWGIEVWKKETP